MRYEVKSSQSVKLRFAGMICKRINVIIFGLQLGAIPQKTNRATSKVTSIKSGFMIIFQTLVWGRKEDISDKGIDSGGE